jgi:hypothetical protein
MAAQVAVGALSVVVVLLLCVRGIGVTERTQAVLVVLQFGMLVLVSVVALVKVFGHHAGPQAVLPQWSWLSPTGLSASAVARGSTLDPDGWRADCSGTSLVRVCRPDQFSTNVGDVGTAARSGCV